jgi:hypothetical protein
VPARGPVEFLADHRSARLASLAGAGFATVAMARRSNRARGLARMGWAALAMLEGLIFLGVFLSTRRKRP